MIEVMFNCLPHSLPTCHIGTSCVVPRWCAPGCGCGIAAGCVCGSAAGCGCGIAAGCGCGSAAGCGCGEQTPSITLALCLLSLPSP